VHCISEDADDDAVLTDAAENRQRINIGAEYADIIENVPVVPGPHHRYTLRDRGGHVMQSFYSVQEAHAWVLNECPNWRNIWLV